MQRSGVQQAALAFGTALILMAEGAARAQEGAAASAWQNAAQSSLGATAKGTGAPFNRDWPADRAIRPESEYRGGTLFGSPMTNGRVDVRLAIPVEIKAVELVPLDYRGTMLPKACDLYVDGRRVRHADLPVSPGKPVRIELEARGQTVGVVVTDTYPPRDLGGGKTGPSYGGWDRIRVLTSTDVKALLSPPESYRVPADPQFVAATGGAASASGGAVRVVGRPRVSRGHPCTLWDAEDVALYRALIATSPALREQYEGLKRAMDRRLAEPHGVPQPRRGPDGAWMHVSDRETGSAHNNLALDIANLGAVYALSGEAKYADCARKILLAYADAYPNYGVGARRGFSHDPSKVFDQRLGDAIWLIQIARGYDLIHDLPSLTPEERRHIEEDLIKAAARFIVANTSHLRSPTNWSAIGTCAALVCGAATDDEDLIDRALFGINSDKNPGRWWEGATNRAPSGIELHFSDRSIDDDGLWAEGAMGYQFMALQALITDAEVLWHRGIDLYRYRNCALKRLFDSPLQFAYPDLTTPALHDSGFGPVVGRDAYLYEFAYRRYEDPRYLPILRQAGRHLAAQYQQWPVSVLYDLDLDRPAEAVEPRSVNFFGVGYGILRLTDGRGTRSLLLDYGPNRSHGHPDKLNLDLWAFGERLAPDPGSTWYEQPLYRRWYHTTMAHNALCVDEREQEPSGADLLVYAPAETLAMQRARCATAYGGVAMDRALFLTADYAADLFGAFGRVPRRLDLCWHLRGQFECGLPFAEQPFEAPAENGYNELGRPRRAATDRAYTARFAVGAQTNVFLAAAGDATTVIAGEGYLGRERPTALLQRRETAATVYANAIDLSGRGAVRAIVRSGGLEQGAALLRVETDRGSDLCFAAYRGGQHALEGLRSDALQALVQRDGNGVRALYLGGGTTLEVPGATLSRQPAGLACAERVETGAWFVANPSPGEAEVRLALPGLAGLEAHVVDDAGRRLAPCTVAVRDGAVALRLPPAGRIELARAGSPGLYEARQAVLRRRQQEEEAARARTRAEAQARADGRERAAAANPVPAGTVVAVQAEAFSGQGGGAALASDKKQAAVGQALLKWDAAGHWLEWTVTVPAAGHYRLALLYCNQTAAEREVLVNGEAQDPVATTAVELPATGGFSNGSDDWRLLTVPDPAVSRPLLLRFRAGANVIRLTNTTGTSVNLDYLAVFSPDVAPDRARFAAALKP